MLVYYTEIPAESVRQQRDSGVDELECQTGDDLLDLRDATEASTPISRAELWRNSLRKASAVCGGSQETEVASSSHSDRDGSGAGHKRIRDLVDKEAYVDAPAAKRRRLEAPGQVGALMDYKIPIFDAAFGLDNYRRMRERAAVGAPDSSVMGKVILPPRDEFKMKVSGAICTGDLRASLSRNLAATSAMPGKVELTRTAAATSAMPRKVMLPRDKNKTQVGRGDLKVSIFRTPAASSNVPGKVMLPQDRYVQVCDPVSCRSKDVSPVSAPSARTSLHQAMPVRGQDLRNLQQAMPVQGHDLRNLLNARASVQQAMPARGQDLRNRPSAKTSVQQTMPARGEDLRNRLSRRRPEEQMAMDTAPTRGRLEEHMDIETVPRPVLTQELTRTPVVLSDSKGRYLRDAACTEPEGKIHWISQSGASTEDLKQWLSSNISELISNHQAIHLYLWSGTCDLTRKAGRRIVLRSRDKSSEEFYKENALRINVLCKQYGVPVTFLETPSYSLEKWNQKKGSSATRDEADQKILEGRMESMNNWIRKLNTINGVKDLPDFNADLKWMIGDDVSHYYSYSCLADGIHPNRQLAKEWLGRLSKRIVEDCQ